MNDLSCTDVISRVEKLNEPGLLRTNKISEVCKRLGCTRHRARRFLSLLSTCGPARLRAVLDYSRLPQVSAVLGLKATSNAYSDEITKLLVDTPFVDKVLDMAGRTTSHIVLLRVPTFDMVEQVAFKRILHALEGKVKSYRVLYTSKAWVEDGYVARHTEQPRIEFDSKDWRILGELVNDASQTLESIAKKTGLQVPSVHRRIKRLTGLGVIQGYAFEPNYELLQDAMRGISFFCAANADFRQGEPFIQKLASQKVGKLEFLYRTHGEFYAVFQIRVRSPKELRALFYKDLAKYVEVNAHSTVVFSESRRDWLGDFADYMQTPGR